VTKTAVPTKERRKEPRMSLILPLRVQGYAKDGVTWEEMTTSEDTSFGGTSFQLRHQVVMGQALNLSLPMPKRFRRYDLTEASYRIYGLVRTICPGQGAARVGVMFLGRHAPEGFENDPGGRYALTSDPAPPAKERRQVRRLDVFVNFTIRRLEGAGEEEKTVAENLGKGGARVLTSLPVSKGEILMLEELGGVFRTRAEIRNVYIGPDRIARLNLRFLDAEAPERLVYA